METLQITLPPALKQFVEQQVDGGSYPNTSEYIAYLVQADQERLLREAIDSKLLEALDANSFTPMTADDWENIRNQVKERTAGLSR